MVQDKLKIECKNSRYQEFENDFVLDKAGKNAGFSFFTAHFLLQRLRMIILHDKI